MAGLLVLSLSTGLFGLVAGSDRAYSRDYRRLLDSLGTTRPIEARVSGGDPYRPYHSRSRSRKSNSVRPSSSTLRGGAALDEEMASRLPVPPDVVRAILKADGRKPENRAAVAVLNLVDGRLQEAVRMLREACDQKPDDPRILNDLAAALLEQSETTGDPWPALEAIEMAERSIQLQPSPPALFNKALALGRWGIRARAIKAWQKYLEQDGQSAWAEEAEQRLHQLEQEVAEFRARPQLLATLAEDVTSFPGDLWANRQLVERVLLSRWAELTLAGRKPDADAALANAETLTETILSPGAALPLFVAAVPPGTAIVEYAIFDDQAVAWILAGGRLDQVKLTVPDRLGERIRYLASERNLQAWKSSSAVLFQALLAPVLAHLSPNIQWLFLIPDSQLYGIPFRALWNPQVGRYVDEDLTISLAPSVHQLLDGDGNQPVGKREVVGRQLSVLSVGFTTFAPDLHLARLSRAEVEAASVLSTYGVHSNNCPVPDWEMFRRCAPKADILHLASHAAATSGILESWLAFPGETVTIERLWRELPAFPRRPLVVLSACQSVATTKGGEGLGGLARPFLAKGAKVVVGTLWKLPDTDASILFPAFHRAYRRSGQAAIALQEVREALARWREVPWIWGGLTAVESKIH